MFLVAGQFSWVNRVFFPSQYLNYTSWFGVLLASKVKEKEHQLFSTFPINSPFPQSFATIFSPDCFKTIHLFQTELLSSWFLFKPAKPAFLASAFFSTWNEEKSLSNEADSFEIDPYYNFSSAIYWCAAWSLQKKTNTNFWKNSAVK